MTGVSSVVYERSSYAPLSPDKAVLMTAVAQELGNVAHTGVKGHLVPFPVHESGAPLLEHSLPLF